MCVCVYVMCVRVCMCVRDVCMRVCVCDVCDACDVCDVWTDGRWVCMDVCIFGSQILYICFCRLLNRTC